MADIASAKVKINDTEVGADKPVSEALFNKIGADINYLIDELPDNFTQEFTSSGTFTVPSDVAVVTVTACGGGGGGYNGGITYAGGGGSSL